MLTPHVLLPQARMKTQALSQRRAAQSRGAEDEENQMFLRCVQQRAGAGA